VVLLIWENIGGFWHKFFESAHPYFIVYKIRKSYHHIFYRIGNNNYQLLDYRFK